MPRLPRHVQPVSHPGHRTGFHHVRKSLSDDSGDDARHCSRQQRPGQLLRRRENQMRRSGNQSGQPPGDIDFKHLILQCGQYRLLSADSLDQAHFRTATRQHRAEDFRRKLQKFKLAFAQHRAGTRAAIGHEAADLPGVQHLNQDRPCGGALVGIGVFRAAAVIRNCHGLGRGCIHQAACNQVG